MMDESEWERQDLEEIKNNDNNNYDDFCSSYGSLSGDKSCVEDCALSLSDALNSVSSSIVHLGDVYSFDNHS